uniref:Reverse transcriptase domain-containing protein n=1 Tax=Strongyloides venezuelensis TaxID=75913 RepID=A0A0K0FSX5_STRVS
MEREVKCKKEVKPIVNEIKDEELLKVESYFSSLSTQSTIKEMREFSKTLNVDWTLSDNEILEALKYCGNFKAPGPDMVMNVCYKWFKSAQNYLIRWIKSTWYGEYRINKKDASVVTYMIWKGNDKPKNDVKSYRPISCLNCDFKLLNKLIANKVYESVEKILPMNQMAVIKGKHGACEALLLDKSLAQSMKFRRRKDVKEIWCSWIDFSKCYDSISHKCLKKMIQSIKAPPTIHKVILDEIDSWNISISSGKNVSKAKIPVKSGILQGEVASPLYFVLLTGGISYALNKKEQVPIETVTPSNTLKINHISFMDDYQLYATSQKKVEKLTVKLREIADEMNLKLNPQKCGIYGADDIGKKLMLKESSLNFPYTSEYKYLGLVENSLDLKDINIQLVKDKILSKCTTIFESRLTTH